jgi:NADPH:quinone reductase-like Zn-dependent oxidoreductase
MSTPATDQENTMKAIVQDKYGSPDALKLEDIDKPVVKDDEVLVRVRAASANPADWHFMRGLPDIMRPQAGLGKPKNSVLGRDIAGQVEAVGKDVTGFRPGDEVFGNPEGGGFAEYTTVSEGSLGLKPANLTFEQAAAVPLAALTALQGLRDEGRVQAEQRVLIIGASGGVGTFAVQIAKSLGADVTAVCSTRNLEMVRSLGADHVSDYTQEDFTQSGQKYDLILPVGGDLLAVVLQAHAHPQGDSRAKQRRIERSLDRTRGSHDQSGRVVAVREPEARHVCHEAN